LPDFCVFIDRGGDEQLFFIINLSKNECHSFRIGYSKFRKESMRKIVHLIEKQAGLMVYG